MEYTFIIVLSLVATIIVKLSDYTMIIDLSTHINCHFYFPTLREQR